VVSFTGFGWFICPLSLMLAIGAIYFFLCSRRLWQDEFKRILDYAILTVFFGLLRGCLESVNYFGFLDEGASALTTEILCFLMMLSIFLGARKTLEFSKKTFGDSK
jgi:hypothetical protein